jgi:hypothetical protein
MSYSLHLPTQTRTVLSIIAVNIDRIEIMIAVVAQIKFDVNEVFLSSALSRFAG